MREIYAPLGNEVLFARYSRLIPDAPTILFIHGLGDSGLVYNEAFHYAADKPVNIIVPDLVGYGRSSNAKDYSFRAHVTRMWGLLEAIRNTSGVEINHLVLAAHSIGSIPAVKMCMGDSAGVIKKIILMEGSITQYGSFVSAKVAEVHEQGRFEPWFAQEFVEKFVFSKYVKSFPFCRHYYASLLFCRPQAFRDNALETYEMRHRIPGTWTHEIGRDYCSLSIPKMYCYGDRSMCEETKAFIKENNLDYMVFDSKCHFFMLDKGSLFYSFLFNFVLADK